MKSCIYSIIFLFLLSSCSPRIISPLSNEEKYEYKKEELSEMETLCNYLNGIVESGVNKKREKYVYDKLKEISDNIKRERIDIYSFQHNYILEIKGTTDKIIYFTAHYDKTDLNIFKFSSVLVNGFLDEPFCWTMTSQGAIDNGTGVATLLELADNLNKRKNYYTYRFLFPGSEESGLRGSRSHVARIKLNEWENIQCCINVDCIGIKDEKLAIVLVKNDPNLTRLSIETAKENNFELVGLSNINGASDHIPFYKTNTALDFGRSFLYNAPGAFLPQRSYFTKSKSTPTLFFSSTGISDARLVDLINPYLPLTIPNGNIHSYSDNLSRIDKKRFYEGYKLIYELVLKIENQKIF